MLYAWERRHGRLPDVPGDVSRQLLEPYAWELRRCGYPVLRLGEMVYGPEGEPSEDTHQGDEGSESHYSSYTIEVPFNSNASRSRGGEEPDGEPGFGDDGEGPDFEPGPFTAMVQRLNREAARVGVPRPGGPRDPVTYPPIQQDEMQGVYPGAGVDLTPYIRPMRRSQG